MGADVLGASTRALVVAAGSAGGGGERGVVGTNGDGEGVGEGERGGEAAAGASREKREGVATGVVG